MPRVAAEDPSTSPLRQPAVLGLDAESFERSLNLRHPAQSPSEGITLGSFGAVHDIGE